MITLVVFFVAGITIVDFTECFNYSNDIPGFILPQIWPHVKYIFPYKIQSPINIAVSDTQDRKLTPLKIHFPSNLSQENLSIENTGDKLRVEISFSPVAIDDIPYLSEGPLSSTKYVFHQVHFHWGENNSCGSEHLIAGKCFSMEVHFVYYHEIYGRFSEALNHVDGLAVVAFFGKLTSGDDADNPELNSLIEKLSQIIGPAKTNGSFNTELKFLKNMFKQNNYYSYPGSLTTPPYSECVTWLIFPEPFAISSKQLEAFKKLNGINGQTLKPSVRALQDFAGRPIITPFE